MNLKSALQLIVDVPDFPKSGIVFKDMTPIFESPKAFRAVQDALKESIVGLNPTKLVAIESRGFVFGGPLALDLSCSLVLARKKGKLPRKTLSRSYGLEYGQDELHIHEGSIQPGDRVIILDDVLATGGTLEAVAELCQQAGGDVMALQVVLELDFLGGRSRLSRFKVQSLLSV